MGAYTKNSLFADPSSVEGIARIMDLGCNLQVYNYSSTPEQADTKAIANDWLAVGQDISVSITQYVEASPKK